jgi:putative transposase
MKKSRYTERIIGTLKRHQASVKDIELCRVHRSARRHFCDWNQKLVGWTRLEAVMNFGGVV